MYRDHSATLILTLRSQQDSRGGTALAEIPWRAIDDDAVTDADAIECILPHSHMDSTSTGTPLIVIDERRGNRRSGHLVPVPAIPTIRC
jgi:hypothetical protein